MIVAKTAYGAIGALNMPKYEATGVRPLFYKDDDGNWELVFTGNCVITFSKLKTAVDVFVVGGGRTGNNGTGKLESASKSYAYGGDGGKGGGIATQLGLTLSTGKEYPVTVGTAGLSSSAFGVTAATGTGSDGGAGAKHQRGWPTDGRFAAGNGSPGVLAFGTADTLFEPGRRYGAGGGGGSAYSTLGGNLAAAGAGGATGGGNGGSDASGGNNGYGEAGAANSGAGGGGGSSYIWNTRDDATYHTRPGGTGGSGIVIIRNARGST